VKATRAEWRRLKPVLAPFFNERDGLWFNKRAELELARAHGLVEKKSRAGKVGANARWRNGADANGRGMADAMANGSQGDAPLPIPLPDSLSRSSVPDDFPDQEARRWAEQHWLAKGRVDLCTLMDEECAKFRDYHNAQDKTSADWDASWRTWVRNAMNFAKAARNAAPRAKAKILTILDEKA
jgi:hypothetical protein